MSETFNSLKRLHQKPKEARRRFGFIVAGGITFVIFLIWLSTLSVSTSQVPIASTDEDGVQVQIATPLETVGRNFEVLLEGIKNQFPGLSS